MSWSVMVGMLMVREVPGEVSLRSMHSLCQQ